MHAERLLLLMMRRATISRRRRQQQQQHARGAATLMMTLGSNAGIISADDARMAAALMTTTDAASMLPLIVHALGSNYNRAAAATWLTHVNIHVDALLHNGKADGCARSEDRTRRGSEATPAIAICATARSPEIFGDGTELSGHSAFVRTTHSRASYVAHRIQTMRGGPSVNRRASGPRGAPTHSKGM